MTAVLCVLFFALFFVEKTVAGRSASLSFLGGNVRLGIYGNLSIYTRLYAIIHDYTAAYGRIQTFPNSEARDGLSAQSFCSRRRHASS